MVINDKLKTLFGTIKWLAEYLLIALIFLTIGLYIGLEPQIKQSNIVQKMYLEESYIIEDRNTAAYSAEADEFIISRRRYKTMRILFCTEVEGVETTCPDCESDAIWTDAGLLCSNPDCPNS